MVRGSSPESPGQRVRMIFLVYCIASLFYYLFVLSPALIHVILSTIYYMIYYPTVMAQYSLFMLKVPLNPKQTNKQTNILCSNEIQNENILVPVYPGCPGTV